MSRGDSERAARCRTARFNCHRLDGAKLAAAEVAALPCWRRRSRPKVVVRRSDATVRMRFALRMVLKADDEVGDVDRGRVAGAAVVIAPVVLIATTVANLLIPDHHRVLTDARKPHQPQIQAVDISNIPSGCRLKGRVAETLNERERSGAVEKKRRSLRPSRPHRPGRALWSGRSRRASWACRTSSPGRTGLVPAQGVLAWKTASALTRVDHP